MTIGALYNQQNVVVGQAAVFFAPVNTPLPALGDLNYNDPFDIAPWSSYELATGAASSFTLTVNGTETSALTNATTTAALLAALEAIVGVGNVTVTGASSPFTISFAQGATWLPMTLTVSSGTGVTLTGGTWTPCGATEQGWKFGTNKSTQTHSIEEQSTPVATAITTQNVTIEGSLAEDIGPLLKMILNATYTRFAAVSGTPGYEELNLTDTVATYAVALVTHHVNGRPRVIYAPQWTQLSNSSVNFRRSAAKRMYPVVFSTICKPSEIRILNLLAPAL